MAVEPAIPKIHIDIVGNDYFLRDRTRAVSSVEYLELVISKLQETLEKSKTHQGYPNYNEQERVYRESLLSKVRSMYQETDGIRLNPEKYRHPGVYFISHASNFWAMKIGRSKHINARMGAYLHLLGEPKVTVHAVIRHKEHRILEKFLHKIFWFCRQQGEWFDFEPVNEWLKDPDNYDWDYYENLQHRVRYAEEESSYAF